MVTKKNSKLIFFVFDAASKLQQKIEVHSNGNIFQLIFNVRMARCVWRIAGAENVTASARFDSLRLLFFVSATPIVGHTSFGARN